jgi:hypothetical protein
LDGAGRSTGRIIKVQCKADEASGACTRYVDLKHLAYWKDPGDAPTAITHELEKLRGVVEHIKERMDAVVSLAS